MKKIARQVFAMITVFSIITTVAMAAGAKLRFSSSYGSSSVTSGQYFPFVYNVDGKHCAGNDAILHKSNHDYNSTLQNLAHGDLGAYYYAYSPMTTTNYEVSAKIDIPTQVDTKGNRNVYINLGYSSNGVVPHWDIGITKQGNSEWAIFVGPNKISDFSRYLSAVWYNGSEGMAIPTGTKTVLFSITLAVTSSNKSQMTIVWDFINSSGKTFKTTTCVITGNELDSVFGTSQGKPFGRFYRFISMIPKNDKAGPYEGDDYNDGSYLNARLYDIRLNYSTWADSSIQQAYSVQSSNYSQLSIGGLTLKGPNTTRGIAGQDTIFIRHNVLLH